MYCPNCKKKVDYNLEVCPHCNHNLSFSSNNNASEIVDKIGVGLETASDVANGYRKAQLIAVLVTILIAIGVIYSFSKIKYINGILGFVFNGAKILKIVGFGGLAASIILYFLFKKSKFFSKLMVLFGACIGISYVLPNFINVNDVSLVDYSSVEYIKFDDIKIPTLYSVVGKRDIVMSDEEENEYDEGFQTYADMVAIVYKSISEDDKNQYSSVLIKDGFKKVSVYTGEEYIDVYAKNYGDSFVTVSIQDLAITYGHMDGKYEDVLLRS